jgi:hypothetical protein
VIIAPWEYDELTGAAWDTRALEDRPFKYVDDIHFPSSGGPPNHVPQIAFDSKGSLIVTDSQNRRVIGQDEIVNLARGSVFYQRGDDGRPVDPPDPKESPPLNSKTNINRIRIDGVTGRARVEREEIQPGN